MIESFILLESGKDRSQQADITHTIWEGIDPQTLLDGIDCGVMLVDPRSCQIVAANRAALEMMGVALEEAVGCSCQRFMCRSFDGECPVLYANHEIHDSEDALLSANGVMRSVRRTAISVAANEVPLILETFVDITRASQQDAAISLYNVAAQSPSTAILAIDQFGHIESYNSAFEELWGIAAPLARSGDAGAVLAHVLNKLKYPKSFAEKFEQIKNNPLLEDRIETQLTDGRIFEWKAYAQSIYSLSSGCVFTVRDITSERVPESPQISLGDAENANNSGSETSAEEFMLRLQTPLAEIVTTAAAALNNGLSLQQRGHMEAVKSSADSLLWLVSSLLNVPIDELDFKQESTEYPIHSGPESAESDFDVVAGGSLPYQNETLDLPSLMRNINFDRTLMRALFQKYLKQSAVDLREMSAAQQVGDMATLAKLARKMKSAAGALSAHATSRAFGVLEDICLTHKYSCTADALQVGLREAGRLARQLQNLISEDAA